jgi:hypothetical protein
MIRADELSYILSNQILTIDRRQKFVDILTCDQAQENCWRVFLPLRVKLNPGRLESGLVCEIVLVPPQ